VALGVIVGWTAFAFGGVYPRTILPAAIGCAVLALTCRPSILQGSPTRRIDLWAIVTIAAMLLQTIPLPRAIVDAIDPASEAVGRALSLVERGGPLPLSIDVSSTLAAVLIFGGAWIFFVTARAIFRHGGVRTFTRMIAVLGLLLSALGLAQSATAHGLMYWRWHPLTEGPDPFGPFVNRNHFATWALMAIPLLAGYLIAHATAHEGPDRTAPWRQRLAAAMDARAWLLIASTTMLIVALVASLSRSGLIGLAGGFACAAFLALNVSASSTAGRSAPRRGRAAALMAVLGAFVILAVSTQVGPKAVAARFGASRVGIADRIAIWHDTLPVVRDFWLTGTGAGTYLTSMAVYQRSSPGVIFNQAHNHYLQVAAEGGLLIGLPVLFALAAFARAALANLAADRTGMYWIRAGAAAGLFGVAVQSLWETGLTIPANAALAAVLAAIVIDAPGRAGARA